MPFDTKLNPGEERQFQSWKSKNAPNDSGEDYDLRGAFKAGVQPDEATGHWPDTYKKPNHPTFSDQSIYSSLAGTKPGHWEGSNHDQYKKFEASPIKDESGSNFLNSVRNNARNAKGVDKALVPIEAAHSAVEYGLNNAAGAFRELVSPSKKGFQWYKSPFDSVGKDVNTDKNK